MDRLLNCVHKVKKCIQNKKKKMESSSFYITCPSNASMDIYKENTQSHFRINLPQRLYLQNNYEVALAEILYPMTYWTFSTEEKYQIAIVVAGHVFTHHVDSVQQGTIQFKS